MRHAARSRRNANRARLEKAAKDQTPLKMRDQLARAEDNAKRQAKRYPTAPQYRNGY